MYLLFTTTTALTPLEAYHFLGLMLDGRTASLAVLLDVSASKVYVGKTPDDAVVYDDIPVDEWNGLYEKTNNITQLYIQCHDWAANQGNGIDWEGARAPGQDLAWGMAQGSAQSQVFGQAPGQAPGLVPAQPNAIDTVATAVAKTVDSQHRTNLSTHISKLLRTLITIFFIWTAIMEVCRWIIL